MSVSSWCGETNELNFDGNGPSECFCYTFFIFLPSVLFLLYVFLLYTGNLPSLLSSPILPASPQQVSRSSKISQKYVLWIFLLGCFLQPLCFGIFSFTENLSPAKITAIGLESFSWITCGISIYYDFHHDFQWPCLVVQIYFCISVAVCVIIVASVYSDQQHSTSFILGVVTFLLSLGMLVLSYFKDSLFPPENDLKYSPVYFPASNGTSPESKPSFFERLIGKRKSSRDEVTPFLHDNEADEVENRHSDLNTTSTRWSHASERSLKEIRLSEGEDSNRPKSISSHLSPASVSANQRPIVQSRVLTRMLEQPQSSRAASALNKSKGGLHGGLAPKGSHLRQDPQTFGGFSAAARAKASDNHNNDLLLPRNQIHRLENLRLLVEKWGLRRQGYGHEEKMNQAGEKEEEEGSSSCQFSERFSSLVRSDEDDHKQGSSNSPLDESTDEMRSSSMGGNEDIPPVSMSQGSNLDSGSQQPRRKRNPQPQQRVTQQKTSLSSTVPGASATSSGEAMGTVISLLSHANPSDPLGTPMEVEFEISFQTIDEAEDMKPEKWVVWRTAKELLSLHAVLVGKFGDAAPRRPKLQTFFPPNVSIESQTVTKTLILSDMRMIAGYLRAVLSQSIFHCPALSSFLEIPVTLLSHDSVSSAATAVAGGSGVALDHTTGDETTGGLISSSPPELTSLISQQSLPSAPDLTRNRSTGMTGGGGGVEADPNLKDQWRKVYVHLKKNLKPREAAVRCRVFDGVICGSDIVKWMITSTHSHAHDQIEACLISQGLISAERLVPVCLGYRQLTDIDHEEVDLLSLPFSNDKGYVYRYPSGSKRTGLFTLFGAPVTISIPKWIQVDGDGNISSGTGSVGVSAASSPSTTTAIALGTTSTSVSTSAAGYVQYTVEVTVGDDRWEVLRRYTEFSQFHRNLQKEKIKPSATFPATSFSQLMMGQVAPVGEAKMDQRRQELELYLRSAIEAILRMGLQNHGDPSATAPAILTMLAEFLDEDHSRLRLAPSDFSPSGETEGQQTGTEQSLDHLSKAVGL